MSLLIKKWKRVSLNNNAKKVGNNRETVALGILQFNELHFNEREHMNKESK